MSDKQLREAIIRLAHEKPELRSDLLPLVTKRAAGLEFSPGDKVVVKKTHGTKKFRGQKGTVEKHVPFNKFYVELGDSGRQLIDMSDLEKA